MPVPPFLAAALQFRVDVADVPANRGRAVRLIEEATARGARLCVLPEMWSTGFAEERLLPPSGEPRWFRRGVSADVVPTDVGALGPLICYDLRFPELPRKYFLGGAAV